MCVGICGCIYMGVSICKSRYAQRPRVLGFFKARVLGSRDPPGLGNGAELRWITKVVCALNH